MSEFCFYDLQERQKHDSIESIFPEWGREAETMVVLAPHDDDALLGPGYLIRAVLENHGRVAVIIFNNGCAGYSSPELKDTIVGIRKKETEDALAAIGIPGEMISRLEFPDFSAINHLGWQLLNGEEGTFAFLVKRLRALKATRLVFANGFLEHIDHYAVEMAGLYDGPQSGDPCLADWGAPARIKTYLQYSVWGKFSPLDALVNKRDLEIRANWAVSVPEQVEGLIQKAIAKFGSQKEIINGILKTREERALECEPGRFIELYLKLDPRPRFDYGPYKNIVKKIDKSGKFK